MVIPDKALEILAYLLLLVNGLIDALVTPLFERYGWDKFPLRYVAWVMAAGMVYLTGINVFVDAMSGYPLVGRILTAVFAGVIVGVGANKLHDFGDKPPSTYTYVWTGNEKPGDPLDGERQ